MRIYDKIESLFGFDIRDFFLQYNDFVNFDLQNIVSFYKGMKDSSIEKSQSTLKTLSNQAEIILSKIEENTKALECVQFYEIVDEFEDLRLKLLTYSNMPKWLGVNGIKAVYSQNNTVDYILSKNEMLETAANRVGYTDRDNGGLSLALENSIKEIDYDLSGGFVFQFNYKDERENIALTTLVDKNLSGEKLLGVDISKKITFVEEDITYLSPEETFNQSCKTLLRLKRGDNPEVPSSGIDKTLLVNRIATATSFPILIRQLNDTISRDDTIKEMNVKDVWFESDSLNMKCDFYSQLSTTTTVNYEN